tara:strand:- start:1967 stop:3271 length:1305 start_codon:yes stop_codon:yes gene_type:complete
MAINIPSLFRDVIETPEQRQQRQMLERLGQAQSFMAPRGSVASLLNPLASATFMNIAESQDRVKENLGGMLGLDMRDSSQKLSDALMAGDPNTPEGLRDLSKQLQNIFPAQSLGLLQAAREQEIADEERLAAKEQRDRQLSIMESEAETAKKRAETAQEQVDVERIKQTFNETVQQDLRDWRERQITEADLDRTLKRDELDLRRDLATLQQEDIDSRTRAALREVDKNAEDLYEQADETKRLAQEFNAANYQAGMAGNVNEKWKSITGTQNEISILKTRFNKIINAAVMDGLPPGAASDKDIELAQQGFPDDSYPPEMIASYLAGMQKLSYIAAEKENERLKFLRANNGSPAMINKETNQVVTFNDHWSSKIQNPEFINYLEEKTKLDFMDANERKAYDETGLEDRRRALQEEQRKQREAEDFRRRDMYRGSTL